MIQGVRNRQVAGANPGQNGLFPPNSFEGMSRLYAQGKMDLTKAKNLVVDEILEIEGVHVSSHTLLEMLFEGPDNYGWFLTRFANRGGEVEIRMTFRRENESEYYPAEWMRSFKGGVWPRIKIVPVDYYDHTEGHKNPREKNKCSYCGEETTQIRLNITHTTARGWEAERQRIIFADVILHCGRFQVKRTGSPRR